jgi:hypothetical protein
MLLALPSSVLRPPFNARDDPDRTPTTRTAGIRRAGGYDATQTFVTCPLKGTVKGPKHLETGLCLTSADL